MIVHRVRNSKNEMFHHLSDDVVNWDVNCDAHLLTASVRKAMSSSSIADVIRVKSYVDSFPDPTGMLPSSMTVSINKLYLLKQPFIKDIFVYWYEASALCDKEITLPERVRIDLDKKFIAFLLRSTSTKEAPSAESLDSSSEPESYSES